MSWDEDLTEIRIPWQQFVMDLPILQQISIPRFLHTRRNIQCVLCGFCDASELGYAAVVYLKVVDSEDPLISLLGAKTKLAPLKASTIPRMELCAALLLARWMARLKRILMGRLHITNTFAWSDSTIVLNWLTTPHESFKIFVSNRIHQIHMVLPECQWSYVASSDNPADSASRGLSPSQLIDHKLYWHGPDWLCSNNDSYGVDIPHLTLDQLPEIKPMKPVMADLPSSRVVVCSPFSRVGIDFAGPLNMKEQCLRKSRHYKVYVAVFVCFVIKTVHLEYVSDLSTEAFLAALKRFVARRGMPTDIYSDCGTNFVGAANHLRQLTNDADCRERLTNAIPCVWHFNPPRAPHFGGLWEAAVRSAKTLMVKITGEHTYTLEEFNTILCHVEAILNSRPLVPTSPDPTEIDILTPGHFLVGRPLLAVPEAVIPVSARPMVQRWKLLNQNVQSFWRRWRRDYLQTLQTRSRWVTDAPNIAVDDLVVVKDLQTPPLQWCMARMIEVVPDMDGVVRVVRLRTATGTMTHPVVKVVKLPTE